MVERSGPYERRDARRAYVRGRASVDVESRSSFEADTIDVSEGGICLTAPIALEPGTVCRLAIELEPPSQRHFTLMGRVCFCFRDQEQYRIGFHCPDLSLS